MARRSGYCSGSWHDYIPNANVMPYDCTDVCMCVCVRKWETVSHTILYSYTAGMHTSKKLRLVFLFLTLLFILESFGRWVSELSQGLKIICSFHPFSRSRAAGHLLYVVHALTCVSPQLTFTPTAQPCSHTMSIHLDERIRCFSYSGGPGLHREPSGRLFDHQNPLARFNLCYYFKLFKCILSGVSFSPGVSDRD